MARRSVEFWTPYCSRTTHERIDSVVQIFLAVLIADRQVLRTLVFGAAVGASSQALTVPEPLPDEAHLPQVIAFV